MNDRNNTKARFIQVNQLPQTDSHLTAKLYVDNAIDESLLVRNIHNNDFGNYNLTNTHSITLNTQAVNDNQVITKAYVDQFHQENEQSRRVLGIDFYDESSDLVKINQDKDLNDNKLTNLDSITVIRNPSSDHELANKKYNDDELDKNTVLRFNQTLENYFKVSVGNDTCNITKNDKIKLTDTIIFKYPNSVGYLLQNWLRKCNDKNDAGTIQNFTPSTKTNSPTGDSGSTSLLLIGDAFMYIEKSPYNHGNNDFVSFERTDFIQISNITFSYNRSSSLTDDSREING